MLEDFFKNYYTAFFTIISMWALLDGGTLLVILDHPVRKFSHGLV